MLRHLFQKVMFGGRTPTRAKSGNRHFLKALIPLLAVIAVGGGVLALNTGSSNAQEEPTIQALVAGDIVPVTVGDFDIAILGSDRPQGVAYNTSTGNYAIVDSTDDEVYIVDSDGLLVSQFDTAGFGSDNPQGIAYNSLADQFAIVDDTDDEVYITDASGALIDQCDTVAIGGVSTGDNVTGIAYNSATDEYAITENGDDEVYIIDATVVLGLCTLNGQFDVSVFGSTNPQGITYNSVSDQYEITDTSITEFYLVDASALGLGTLVAQFDTTSGGIGSSTGVAFNPDERVSAIVDSSLDDLRPIDHSGTLVSQFDLAGLPISYDSPSGITFIPSLGELAISDDLDDEISRITTAGALVDDCDISGQGIINPQGLAFLAATNEYAVIDTSANEVFFLDVSDQFCGLVTQFDTAVLGSDAPTDIGLNFSTGELLILDSTDDALRLIDLDPNQEINGQFSVATFGYDSTLGASNPQGIHYISGAGNYAVTDVSDDEVYGMNSYGMMPWHFDTAILGATFPEGLTTNPATGEVFLVDSGADEVYVLDLPRVLEPTTITGTFFSAAVGITLQLEETGDGFFSGFAGVAGAAPAASQLLGSSIRSHAAGFDASGVFNPQTGDFTMTVVTAPPTGALLAGSVSADLNTITIGTVTFLRQ